MGKIKIMGAILSALNTAVPLILDAQAIWPDWAWQYLSLAGFVVFVLFVVWILWDMQAKINELEASRPQLTIGQGTSVEHHLQEKGRMHIQIRLSFRNIGGKPAYEFTQRLGIAPDGFPARFRILNERTCVNRLDPMSSEFGQKYDLYIEYDEKDGQKIVPSKSIMIHCYVSYSDSEKGIRRFGDEWWFAYHTDNAELKSLSSSKKQELEPYVKEVYKKKGINL